MLKTENYVLLVDPATAEVIVKVGEVIVSIFKKDPNNDYTVWLKQISDKLDKIRMMLGDVLAAIEDLKVYIDKAFEYNTQLSLLSVTNRFVINYPTWKMDLRSDRTQNEMLRLYGELQQFREVLMLRGGYATFNTVGYAMRFETSLMELTKQSAESKTAALKRYFEYFYNCSNPPVLGGVGATLNTVRSQITNLEQSYPARNNYREQLDHEKKDLGEEIAEWDNVMYTSGSLAIGWTGRPAAENYQSRSHHRPGGGKDPYLIVSTKGTMLTTTFLSNWTNAVFGERMAALESASKSYLKLKAQEELLVLSLARSDEYKKIAKDLLTEAEGGK